MAKVPANAKAQIVALLEEHEQTGFVDYITISSSILFSSHYATDLRMLQKESFYNNVRQIDYICNGYLDGLEIVKYDYRELFDLYKNATGVMFFVDPPYLSTDAGMYKCYWKLREYLDVLRVIDGRPYIYFTSNKSNIVELIDWMQSNSIGGNPFVGANRREFNVSMNCNAKYTDIMLYRA